MNVVDSSAWLEHFAEGSNVGHFAKVIEHPEALLVPSVTLLDVFKRAALQRDEQLAFRYVAAMRQGAVVDLHAALALRAADLGVRHKLPLASSIIYAAARAADAWVWTQDADFAGLPGAKVWRNA